jgi:uncharacterized protein DUF3467
MKDHTDIRSTSQPSEGLTNVRWDDSSMRSQYSNVCNVTGTREEIILLFGVHQAWRPDQKELTVQLQERIVINPYAAKRLNLLLSRVLKAYETRYGVLQIEGTGPGESLPTT